MLIGEVFSLYKAIPSFMAQPINLRFPTYFPPPHRPLLLLLLPPMRLNFLGSGGKGPNVSANFHQNTGACFFLPFRLIFALSLVPWPPSQKPVYFFPMRMALHIPQSSGRYRCSREQYPLGQNQISFFW